MPENFLQLNQDKTEVLVIGPASQRVKLLSKLQSQSFNPFVSHAQNIGIGQRRRAQGENWAIKQCKRLYCVHIPSLILTLLAGLVKNLYVFELDSDARPQRHRVSGIVLVSSFDGAIRVSPKPQNIVKIYARITRFIMPLYA